MSALSPPPDCARCARLAAFRKANATVHPDWHNAPVTSFGAETTRLLIVGLAMEDAAWAEVDAAGWALFLLFAFYPLCLCYILWFWSLSVLPATVASIAGLVSPAAGVALSALVLGEPLGVGESAALALILAAIGLLVLRPRNA